MEGKEYQKLAMRTNDSLCSWRLDRYLDDADVLDAGGMINACLGLSGEVGELNDMIKKHVFHGHNIDEVKVKKEIGDICWYVAMMCESLGYSLDEIMQMNIDKLKARYPEGFSEEASQHRKEGDV